MKELISVIIPVFNVGKYIEKCIQSVVAQDYHNIEIILVDDGSSDVSSEICDRYANNDNRIKVIHKINEGVSKARNIGLDISIGKYCCFIDGDDFIEYDYISKMYNAITTLDTDMVCCGCWRERIDGKVIWERKIDKTIKYNRRESILELFTPTSFVGWPWNKMFKISIIRDNNIRFDENLKYCEDEIFVLQYLFKSKGCCYIKEQLYHYIENQMSVNMKIYTEKKFDVRCLDRQKADNISKAIVESLKDSELQKIVNARIFTSNIATLSKLIAGYNNEKDILTVLRANLRKTYKDYIFNKRFPKSYKRDLWYLIACINPILLIKCSKVLNKQII